MLGRSGLETATDHSRHQWSLMLSLSQTSDRARPMFASLELLADCLVSLAALWVESHWWTGLTLGLYNGGEKSPRISRTE